MRPEALKYEDVQKVQRIILGGMPRTIRFVELHALTRIVNPLQVNFPEQVTLVAKEHVYPYEAGDTTALERLANQIGMEMRASPAMAKEHIEKKYAVIVGMLTGILRTDKEFVVWWTTHLDPNWRHMSWMDTEGGPMHPKEPTGSASEPITPAEGSEPPAT